VAVKLKEVIHLSGTGWGERIRPPLRMNECAGNETLRTGKADHPPRLAASTEYVGSASSHFTSPEGP
jgi:hypothetical protein